MPLEKSSCCKINALYVKTANKAKSYTIMDVCLNHNASASNIMMPLPIHAKHAQMVNFLGTINGSKIKAAVMLNKIAKKKVKSN